MCFVREIDSIELAIFPALELSQKIEVFLQLKICFVHFVGKMDNILQEFYFCDFLKQSIELSFCGAS